MSALTVGLGVFACISAVFYVGARLAPPPRSEGDLNRIRSERGERAASRFEQMDLQREQMLRAGHWITPLAAVAFVLSALVDLAR